MIRARVRLSHALARGLLPEGAREPVLGDLAEEGLHAGTLPHAVALVGLAAHVHVEPWRDEGARLALVALTLAGLGLVWAVRASAWPADPPLDLFLDPVSRGALRLWAQPHLTSAAAAGLLMGHAAWIPSFAEPARWQAVLLVAGLAGSIPAGSSWSAAPTILLMFCAWLGGRAREERAADAVRQFAAPSPQARNTSATGGEASARSRSA